MQGANNSPKELLIGTVFFENYVKNVISAMNSYKINFARNEIISCEVSHDQGIANDIYHYEHKNGNLIFAIIKAKTEENALCIANILVKEVTKKVFGSDFVN